MPIYAKASAAVLFYPIALRRSYPTAPLRSYPIALRRSYRIVLPLCCSVPTAPLHPYPTAPLRSYPSFTGCVFGRLFNDDATSHDNGWPSAPKKLAHEAGVSFEHPPGGSYRARTPASPPCLASFFMPARPPLVRGVDSLLGLSLPRRAPPPQCGQVFPAAHVPARLDQDDVVCLLPTICPDLPSIHAVALLLCGALGPVPLALARACGYWSFAPLGCCGSPSSLTPGGPLRTGFGRPRPRLLRPDLPPAFAAASRGPPRLGARRHSPPFLLSLTSRIRVE
ncbi:hypothetical protein FB451DRAFT_1566797 [Mycena latifolia]|nr:hypothetical protein FB451DRAFT_1566797 [Mycena latifolia]